MSKMPTVVSNKDDAGFWKAVISFYSSSPFLAGTLMLLVVSVPILAIIFSFLKKLVDNKTIRLKHIADYRIKMAEINKRSSVTSSVQQGQEGNS